FYFFFSSRRRHTRFSRDWSSDVCSSDLQNVLKVSAILGLALTISAVFTDGYVSVGSVALLGLANSLMWPAIWPLTLAGLGRYTKIGRASCRERVWYSVSAILLDR